MGAFSVKEAPDDDQNGYPDTWEKLFGITDPKHDPDVDNLLNYEEYRYGTNPNDSDSDDGGEKDGSEVSGGRDPLNPVDDLIDAPEYLHVRPWTNAALLQFDRKPAYSFIRLFRRLGLDDPWTLIYSDMGQPGTGIYTDTQLTNGQTYFYRLEGVITIAGLTGEPAPAAVAGVTHSAEVVSALLTSEGVIPSA